MVVGEQGTILTSTDEGATWTQRISGTNSWLVAATYSPTLKRYFAVGDGGIILSSADAVAWVREASPTSIRLNGVTDSGNGTVYAIGESGAGLLQRDPNGVWTRSDVGFGNRWMRGLILFDQRCAVGQGGAIFTPQPDAPFTTAWSQTPVTTTEDLESIAYGVAAGAPVGSLGFNLVAVGGGGTILQSSAGKWVARSSGTAEHLRGVCWKTGAGLTLVTLTVHVTIGEYFAVGTNGVILRSRDGTAWQADAVPTRSNLNTVLTTQNTVLAVGDGGTILQTGGTGAAPVITRAPVTGLDANGQPYAEATVAGDGALTYLWVQLTAGPPSPVGTNYPRQSLALAPWGWNGGTFQLLAGNAFGLTGSATFTPNRFLNLAGRALVGSGDNVLIGGFSIAGIDLPRSRTVLIRAVGPALANFGAGNPLRAPRLSLFAGSQLIAANTGWESNADPAAIRSAAQGVGAFPLASGAADSALLLTLTPGNYTAQISSADGAAGVALIEIYDTDPPGLSRLKNLSARAQVQTGAAVLIGGLVIDGGVKKNVLLRAAGPALAQFSLPGFLAQPKLILFKDGNAIATVAAWGNAANVAAIRDAAKSVGAFPFADGSADSAMLLQLDPGAYTVQVAGADGGTGVALVEVYEVP